MKIICFLQITFIFANIIYNVNELTSQLIYYEIFMCYNYINDIGIKIICYKCFV